MALMEDDTPQDLVSNRLIPSTTEGQTDRGHIVDVTRLKWQVGKTRLAAFVGSVHGFVL